MYNGENTEAEHEAEAARLGGKNYYHMRLVNALLGAAEGEALIADSSGVTFEQMDSAHQQTLETAGVENNPVKLLGFLRWRTLRIAAPLRKIAQNQEVGPVPLSAAWAAEALQRLLSSCASGQNPAKLDPKQTTAELRSAREALKLSLANLDIMLDLLDAVEKM